MEDLGINIIRMREYAHTLPTGAGHASLLDECRDMAVKRLADAFSQSLATAADELMGLAERRPSHEMYCLYMDTRDIAHLEGEALTGAFRLRMFERFNQERRRGLVDLPGGALDMNQLNLVETDELELTLAGNTLAHALQTTCTEELPPLDRRMGSLLNDPELKLGHNPLGAEVVSDSIMDAIRGLQTGNKVKLMLITRLNLALPKLVKPIYQDLNAHLVSQGVLPTIQFGVKQRGAATAAAGKPAETMAGTPETGNRDIFAMLQQLMSMGRIGTGVDLPSLPELPGARQAEAANEPLQDAGVVMQRLTRIQHGELGELPGHQLDAAVVANGQANVLRAIKNTGAAGNMGHMEAMTLDIVALMFDYILDDRRLPDAMKALIGRLQIPVLKVAMLDKAFFTQKAHPARKLLDTLAEAAIGWDAREGHDGPLYRKVDESVQRILNEFDDKVDIFATVLQDFLAFLAEEKRLADERACHSAQILQGQEQQSLARTLAQEAVQGRLLDRPPPAAIQVFLQGTWAEHLAILYLQGGASGERWKQGQATMDDLLWSLTPKHSREERQQLVALLPKLLKRLDEGIQAVGLSREERDRFFAALVQFHSKAVKPSTADAESAEVPAAPAFSGLPGRLPDPLDEPELRPIPTLAAEMEIDQRILREISTLPEADAEEIVIGDVVGQDRLAGEDSRHEDTVRNLKRGAWLEFTLEDGSSLRAKLAWVSPLRGTYLFTNRLGERAVSINASGLAGKLRDGSAKVVDNVALIDRAVSSLFERLQKSA
ncbi:MAG: DUF1631 domain-containing protein [Pseudomonadota bacterium]